MTGPPPGFPRHLVSIRDLTGAHIEWLLALADRFDAASRHEARVWEGGILGVLFFQPSTRTRLGFETAALRLGASVTGFSDPSTSRSADSTSESLEDTARVVGILCDLLVIRHFVSGAARRASEAAAVPVVNGGDGSNEHPTQALSDARLMIKRLGGLGGAVIGLVGDPGTRVFRSLVLTLVKLGVGRILFLVPPIFLLGLDRGAELVHTTLPGDVRRFLDQHGIAYEFRSDIEELLTEADAIEMMPIEIPNLEANPKLLQRQAYMTPERFRVTAEKIALTRSRSFILHPGPRADELHRNTDGLSNSLYFEQVADSVPVRMATLAAMSGITGGQRDDVPEIVQSGGRSDRLAAADRVGGEPG